MRAKPCITVNVIAVVVAAIALSGCASDKPMSAGGAEMTLSVSSQAFREGEKIPAKYSCDGQNISPPLIWDEPPAETRSFALIVDDPDAPGGTFTHWILFNLPATNRELPEAIPTQDQLPNGALQGKNDFGKVGYGGPCPPAGHPHRYQFTLYALDRVLDLTAGASREQLTAAMQGHIIARGRLTGTYQH